MTPTRRRKKRRTFRGSVSIGEDGFNDNGNAGAGDATSCSGSEEMRRPRGDPTMSNDGSYVFFESPVGLTPQALNDVPIGYDDGRAPDIRAERVRVSRRARVPISDGRDLNGACVPDLRRWDTAEGNLRHQRCLPARLPTPPALTCSSRRPPSSCRRTRTRSSTSMTLASANRHVIPCISHRRATVATVPRRSLPRHPRCGAAPLSPGTATFNGEGNLAPPLAAAVKPKLDNSAEARRRPQGVPEGQEEGQTTIALRANRARKATDAATKKSCQPKSQHRPEGQAMIPACGLSGLVPFAIVAGSFLCFLNSAASAAPGWRSNRSSRRPTSRRSRNRRPASTAELPNAIAMLPARRDQRRQRSDRRHADHAHRHAAGRGEADAKLQFTHRSGNTGAGGELTRMKTASVARTPNPRSVPCSARSPEVLPPDEMLRMYVFVTVNEEARRAAHQRGDDHRRRAPATVSPKPGTTKTSTRSPPLGISSFGFSKDDLAGTEETQAGGHPYELVTTIDLNTEHREDRLHRVEFTSPEDVKDIVVNLPLGFAGSTLAAPECTLAQLSSEKLMPARHGRRAPLHRTRTLRPTNVLRSTTSSRNMAIPRSSVTSMLCMVRMSSSATSFRPLRAMCCRPPQGKFPRSTFAASS